MQGFFLMGYLVDVRFFIVVVDRVGGA
ncbi:MAG: hypothetical protein ACI92E_002862, partial [Oceanicoccus sp.]